MRFFGTLLSTVALVGRMIISQPVGAPEEGTSSCRGTSFRRAFLVPEGSGSTASAHALNLRAMAMASLSRQRL